MEIKKRKQQLSDRLIAIDLEIASTCNAACPVCIRRDRGHVADFSQEMRTLEDVKRIFEGTAHKLFHIQLCGNYGDPMTCREILPICEWFKEKNPKVHIQISTNGGIGNPAHYKRLGELGVGMVFGVDGASNDTLQLHRVNVQYDRVLRNMEQYFSNCTSHYHEWQYILFDENKHEVKDALKKAKELGIKVFFLRYPNGFEYPGSGPNVRQGIPVYNFVGDFTHWLTPVSDEFKPWLDTHWEIQKDNIYNPLIEAIEKVPTIINEDHTGEYDIPIFYEPENTDPYDGVKTYDVNLDESMLEHIKNMTRQECFSLNQQNPKDLTKEMLNIFISYDNIVYPCCMVGSAVSRAKQKDYDGSIQHINHLINDVSASGYNNFSVKDRTLKEVIDSGILHETYFNKIKNNSANAYCKLTCGKCDGSRSPNQVV